MDEEEETLMLMTMRPKDNQKLSQRQTRDKTEMSCIDQEVKCRDTNYPDRDLKYYRIQVTRSLGMSQQNTRRAILVIVTSHIGSESY